MLCRNAGLLRCPLIRRASSSSSSPSSSFSPVSSAHISLEDHYCAKTYSPLPFVISRAEGVMTWSPEGVQRMDFLSAFSAANQGHCHPVRAQHCVLIFVRVRGRPRRWAKILPAQRWRSKRRAEPPTTHPLPTHTLPRPGFSDNLLSLLLLYLPPSPVVQTLIASSVENC
jgi:hypothetical protein